MKTPNKLFKNKFFSSSQEELEVVFKEIIHNVHIKDDFHITHPAYEAIELHERAMVRFQQAPKEFRDKYLGRLLRNFLYGIYYNNSIKTVLEIENKNSILNLENNIHLGADVEFYDKLQDSNTGEGYPDPGWCVKGQDDDGKLAVFKDGLTLHIDRERHLLPSKQVAAEGDIISIRMPKNLIKSGYYIAVANVGPKIDKTAEIYFNVSAEGAAYLMRNLTEGFNQVAIPFTLKALYNPSEYECRDPLTLYFSCSDYEPIREVLQSIYAEGSRYFQDETPLFTKRLAPGLGLAEEPEDTFSEAEDFGQNRCQVVADGLLEAWQQGDETVAGRMKAVLHRLSLHKISLERPYLNPHSEDIYSPLEPIYQ